MMCNKRRKRYYGKKFAYKKHRCHVFISNKNQCVHYPAPYPPINALPFNFTLWIKDKKLLKIMKNNNNDHDHNNDQDNIDDDDDINDNNNSSSENESENDEDDKITSFYLHPLMKIILIGDNTLLDILMAYNKLKHRDKLKYMKKNEKKLNKRFCYIANNIYCIIFIYDIYYK